MEVHDLLAGSAVVVGLIGTLLVFLPGLVLQVAAVLVWSLEESSAVGWVTLGLVAALAVAATILKYLYPRRRLTQAGIPGWVMFVALIAAIIGLFAIPVVGGPIGFVVTIYVFERARHGKDRAWPSTKTAIRAVLTSTGIELTGAFLIFVVFVGAALMT
ncbi:MAG TPA: DUF456 domain-containing protein [Acidimicrobiia bacterium]|nr:DUF456 domain-containing protein [Acidimicrobiia bacterium]